MAAENKTFVTSSVIGVRKCKRKILLIAIAAGLNNSCSLLEGLRATKFLLLLHEEIKGVKTEWVQDRANLIHFAICSVKSKQTYQISNIIRMTW